jgi:hypothetical protein
MSETKRPCPECGGCGYIITVAPDHAPGCTGERCVSGCPIPVECQDTCPMCVGYGEVPTEEAPHA